MRDVQANQTRYYHFDNQGTTQALTDSTGVVTDRFACDAWGVQVKRTGSSINKQWYVGRVGYYRQVDEAMDYVRARWLGLQAGAWSSREPIRLGRQYVYAANSPARWVDASGLAPVDTSKYNNLWSPVDRCSDTAAGGTSVREGR
jgi:RHS repeat-associated protein